MPRGAFTGSNTQHVACHGQFTKLARRVPREPKSRKAPENAFKLVFLKTHKIVGLGNNCVFAK